MPIYYLDYSDVVDIFKNNLKIENSVKSISHTFLNERFSSKIDFAPYYQRNYVWDEEKASYFIESILLGTEIPPIVLFDNGSKNEVIDGRQRYETIKRFLENRIELKEKGLHSLFKIAGKYYSDLQEDLIDSFINTKIRILQFSIVNEPSLSFEKEDKIKKEIFRRYNSGITALSSQEIERAEFINDPIAQKFKRNFEENSNLRKKCINLFVPKTKHNMRIRDVVNYLLTRSRLLLTMPLIPIYSYASGSSKSEIVKNYYFLKLSERNVTNLFNEFCIIVEKLINLKEYLIQKKSELCDNTLFYDCMYWGFSILISNQTEKFETLSLEALANDILSANKNDIFWKGIQVDRNELFNVFFATGSHYYKSIVNRYIFIANYFSTRFNIDFTKNLKNSTEFNSVMQTDIAIEQFKEFRLNKTDPISSTIYDIIRDIKETKFIIRPEYQRSEVKNQQKASYLLESILLGIKIPPLFILRKKNKVSEVIDGQQRLLTIIGFLGEQYMEENGKKALSEKHLFKLSQLRILKDLNGKDINSLEQSNKKYKDCILDFPIDIVEINEEQNPNFQAIDLFLRLNTKPYPIGPNTFEMWNAYVNKDIICEIKEIARAYSGILFKQNDARMSNEELTMTLAFLAYKKRKENLESISVLNIFTRSNRINARIDKKGNITNALSELDKNGIAIFKNSVKDVVAFIEKLQTLTGQNFEHFTELIAHRQKNTQSRTNQNFYLLWIMLTNISCERLIKEKSYISSKIIEKFEISQKTPDNFVLEDYIKDISRL